MENAELDLRIADEIAVLVGILVYLIRFVMKKP